MPFRISERLVSSRLPQSTTTLVVPSPASTSCDFESSTSILAVGWKTCMWLMIVAPSFVMITSPSLLWIILSMPLGPSDERTASATPLAAMMFALRTSCSFARSWKRPLPPPPPPAAAPAPPAPPTAATEACIAEGGGGKGEVGETTRVSPSNRQWPNERSGFFRPPESLSRRRGGCGGYAERPIHRIRS